MDVDTVVARARQRRGRRTAALSSAAALLVVAGAVGVGSQVLPRGATTQAGSAPSSPADGPAEAAAGQAPDQGAAAQADTVPEGARDHSSSVLTCPTSVPWSSDPAVRSVPVPAVPEFPGGQDADSRLVPTEVPTAAIVCTFASDEEALTSGPTAGPGVPTSSRLTGATSLTGDLAAIPADLATLPRAINPRAERVCTAMAGPTTPYLLGLRYANGAITWVGSPADPNGCSETTNGRFTSPTSIGDRLARALQAGSWPAR